MFHWIYTLFVLVHGLVHMVYVSFAQGWVVPETGNDWIGTSWLLSGSLGEQGTRNLGSVVFGAITALFVVSAIGLGFRQAWSVNWLVVTAVASSLSLMLFWDGKWVALSEKGIIGLMINIALLVGIYAFRFPSL